MAGLYLHIPFCASRCIYCGFNSTVRLEWRQQYVDALCREMEMRPSEETVTTVYLGGGTPSQLSTGQLEQILSTAFRVYRVAPQEITIECNPDDVTAQWAVAMRQLGVNRVSMGVQTFDDGRLRFLHRRHNASQVRTAIGLLRHAGFDNISIDLIYGFPQQTVEQWLGDIRAAIALGVEHLSAYALSYEEGTPLYRMRQQGEVTELDEECSRRMYDVLMDRMAEAGYEHYEISNFALPGRFSRHNSSYWQDVPYLGLGAAAHSYDLKERRWNVADIRRYVDCIAAGQLPVEGVERIDGVTRYNDRITVALRTREGVNLSTLDGDCRQFCLKEAKTFLDGGLLEQQGDWLRLTRDGIFVSDMVMAALMRV